MEMKTSSLILVAVVLGLVAFALLKISDAAKSKHGASFSISTYQECVDAGYPVSGYPAECKMPNGTTYMDPEQFVQVFTDFAPQSATSSQ